MLALKVIEGGKGGETLFSGPEWEEIKRELREIELEIRNFPEDREREKESLKPLHLGKKNREKLSLLLTYHPWMSVREVAEKLFVSERIIAMTLRRGWALGIYCRRGITSMGRPKFLWAHEGTPPY